MLLTLFAKELDVSGEVLSYNLVIHVVESGHFPIASRSRLCKANLFPSVGGRGAGLSVSVIKQST